MYFKGEPIMKKLFCMTLAVLMILTVVPFATFAATDKAVGVQTIGTTDAQITSAVCSIWYVKDGVEVKHADYSSIDAASEGLRDLYVGPLADTTLTDTDGDGNLNNELYAAAGSPVIKLNGNFQGSYTRPNWATDPAVGNYIAYDPNKVITVVIDGAKNETENYTVTYGNSSKYWNETSFNHIAFYNLTIKNTNIVINSGANTVDGVFCWGGNAYRTATHSMSKTGESFTVFENCSIMQWASSTNGSGCLFKMNGHSKFDSSVTADPCKTDKYNLILKDTVVETQTGIGHQAHWGADVNIELYNSIMVLSGNAGDSSNNNDSLLKFYEAGIGRVYLDSTSKLISRRSRAGATSCLIRTLSTNKAPVTVELEAGAELSMQNTATLKRSTYIADAAAGGCTVIDKGAVFSANVTDAKNGVHFPVSMKNKTWLVGSGITGQVAHPTNITVDPDTGDETITTDTARLVYVNASATHGMAATSTGTAPLTIKKNGEAVNANVTDINGAFDYVYAQADSEAYTIYFNGSMTTDEYLNPETYDSKAVKTVRIDGQGYGLMSYNSTATFYGIGLYNLKISNLNILSSAVSALDWSPRKTPSDSYGNYIATGSNPVVDTYAEFTNVIHAPRFNCKAANLKLKGGNSGAQNLGAYHITMTDSTFICNAADTMFMMNDKGNLDLKVIGSKILYKGGASDNDGNNYIFALNGAEVNISVENSENNVAVLESNSRSSRVTSGIFSNGTNYAVNITLGKDVELILNGNKAKTDVKYLAVEKATTTITDNGAKWIIDDEILGYGAAITLPTFKTNGKDQAWYVNGEAVTNPYADATATAPVVLTHALPVDPAEGKVAYIEIGGAKEYYVTLQSAINAVSDLFKAVTTENVTDEELWKAAGSPVIYLYDDITIASEHSLNYGTYDANRVFTLVIKGAKKDGTNPVITSTNAGAAFSYNAYYNLTLENIDLTCTQGFALFWRGYNGNNSGKSTTSMINCNISATGTSGEGLVFKVTGNQKTDSKTEDYIINMVNTDVVAQRGVNAVFLFHHGCAGTLNIDSDSSIHHVMNKNSDGGDTIFMLGTNRKFVINIADGAKLSAELEAGRPSGYKSYAMFRIEGSDSYPSLDGIKNEINIGDNVEMSITGSGNYGMPAYFIHNGLVPTETAKKTIVTFGENVKMSVDANVAADGFGAYYGQACNLGTILGAYHNNDTTKLYNNVIAAGVINEAVTNITPVFYNPDDFAMVIGASLRTVWQENGIRFSTTYTDDLAAKLCGQATFGTVIAPTKLLDGAALTTATEGALNVVSTKNVDGDGITTYHAAVIMNPADVAEKDVYTLELTARGYMTLTYADGSTVTIYAAANDNVRDMYTTAKNLAAKGETNMVIEHIISTVEADA